MKINNSDLRRIYRSILSEYLFINRKNCPSPKVLLMNTRRKKPNQAILGHISQCPFCTQEVKFITHIIKTENELLFQLNKFHEKKPKIILNRKNQMRFATVVAIIMIITTTKILVLKKSDNSIDRSGDFASLTLIKPIKEKISLEHPLFQWERNEHAIRYKLEIFDSTLRPVIRIENISSNSFVLNEHQINHVRDGKSYFWMVSAFLKDGSIIESSLVEFN